MSKDTIIEFKTPEAERTDPLTDLLRTGAQQLIANAVEAELHELLEYYADSKDEQGRQMIVRNGYLPAREIQTGIGPVKVKVPKARDRSGSGICFHSFAGDPGMTGPGRKCEYRLLGGNVRSCGNLVVRQMARERHVWSKPAIQRQIPECFSRMSGIGTTPDIHNFCLLVRNVLEADL